ncbi:MAG TPA: DUF6090 family protein [Flavobacteriaceae bacterium]|nr:DUF6090 family protein [Flavobacteriaceae bacterium]
MIKFFRNIRKKLLAEGKTTNYLKYAIGEIILVVIGILIALQLNNWNESRKERTVETSILNELISDLNSDLNSLHEDVELNKRAIRSNLLIHDHLSNNKEYHDSLDVHFGNIQYNTQFTVNTGGFENLKSRGFEIISNDSIRKAIIELQDRWYDYLFTIGNRNNVINFEQFSPKYQKYFTNFNNVFVENVVSFTPLNYEELKGNNQFLQLISYQKFINENTVQVLDNTINLINELISKIEVEIKSKS